jgi:hypothetical protein
MQGESQTWPRIARPSLASVFRVLENSPALACSRRYAICEIQSQRESPRESLWTGVAIARKTIPQNSSIQFKEWRQRTPDVHRHKFHDVPTVRSTCIRNGSIGTCCYPGWPKFVTSRDIVLPGGTSEIDLPATVRLISASVPLLTFGQFCFDPLIF